MGQGQVLHYLQFYGWAHGGVSAREKNEQLLAHSLLWLAGFGKVPCMVFGDLNMDLSVSPGWAAAHMAGWRDIGQGAGPTCLPTRGQPSRLDYALANREAQAFVHSFQLRWDLGIPTHAAVVVELLCPPPEKGCGEVGVLWAGKSPSN